MGAEVRLCYTFIMLYIFFNFSYHPYLFFNKDGTSITFVGFNVSRNGDIQDPNKGNVVIERRAMTPQLHTGLRHNQVDLSENYRYWNKNTMINKIGMVMGLEWSYDPDSSYVLTIDNVIKIMAIHMRFRYYNLAIKMKGMVFPFLLLLGVIYLLL